MNKLFQKNIRTSFFLLLFMMIGGFLFFGEAKNVNAAGPAPEACVGTAWAELNTGDSYCTCTNAKNNSNSLPGRCTRFKISASECASKANEGTKDNPVYSTCYSGIKKDGEVNDPDPNATAKENKTINKNNPTGLGFDICWSPSSPISSVFGCLLVGVLKFFSWLLSVAAMVFAWAADATTLRNVINGDNIYKSWMIVRDLLNITFILVLLYTAFTIIFQVDSSNKKIILTVVLMALLVNFSFPITRFIIDVGNSLMYTIFKNLFPEATSDISNIFSNIAAKSAIGNIISATDSGSSVAQLISAIIFVAILAITLLMMSMLFVIRIVALSILIIFSPVAFVGVIVPSISSKIDWWGNLFKYTFFGPAMAFMLFIATKVMSETQISTTTNKAFSEYSRDPSGGSLIASFGAFAVPIVILWIGMGIAQKMGIEGAAMAQKFATNAVTWLPKAIAHSTGIPGGFKKAKDHYVKKGAPGFLGKIPGLRGEEATERLEAQIGGLLTKGPKGWRGATENIQRKRIAAKQKEFEDERLSESAAKSKLKSGDNVEREAAALYLSKKDKINDSATFADAMTALAGDEELQKELRGKAKKDNNIKFVLDYDLKNGVEVEVIDATTGEKRKGKTTDPTKVYEKVLDMSSDDLAKQKSLHDTIESDANLRSYINSTDDKYLTKLFEKLTPTQRATYLKNGLNPEGRNNISGQSQQSQPKRKMEDVGQDYARKNQENIDKQFPESMEDREKRRSQKADTQMQDYFDKNETS